MSAFSAEQVVVWVISRYMTGRVSTQGETADPLDGISHEERFSGIPLKRISVTFSTASLGSGEDILWRIREL